MPGRAPNAPQPNERALASIQARVSRFGQYRTVLYAAGACVVLAGASWFIHLKHDPPPQAYTGQVAPMPYKAEVPVVIRTPAAAQSPAQQQTQQQAPPQAAAPPATAQPQQQQAPAVPQLSSVGYRQATMPDYMKPKTGENAGPPHSGIEQKGTTYTANMAFRLPHPEFMLRQFEKIPCILDTKVITGVGGLNPFTCHVPAPGVFSRQHVLLLDPGTIIGGFYQSVVTEGDSRVVMASATATTPNDVVVPLTNDPIADMTGAAGVEGDVNNNWMRRIGGALVLALADETLNLLNTGLQNRNGNGNNSLNIGNVSGSTSSLNSIAQMLASKEMQIPATITLNQGTLVTFWTTKEFTDFSQVYGLQPLR